MKGNGDGMGRFPIKVYVLLNSMFSLHSVVYRVLQVVEQLVLSSESFPYFVHLVQ